jgi:ABC-2 type transport system permease protein
MTAASPPAVPASGPAARAGRAPGARFAPLLLAEWTKLRSVRSTIWSVITFVVVAGVLTISSEYSTGTIRASLLAVPRRLPMLAAKGTVFALLVLVVSELVALGSFFAGPAILRSHAPVALGDPGVARAVVGEGLYLAVLGLFSMAIGALMRHTAGAVAMATGVAFVLPVIASFLPGSWGQHVHDYLPSVAGAMIAQAHQGAGQVLSPWQGFGILCAWTALLLAAAFYLLRRRDA